MSRQSRTGSRREGFPFRPDPAGRYRQLWPSGYFADLKLLTRSTRLLSLLVAMKQFSDGGACLAGELRFAEDPGGEADRGERVNLACAVQNQSPVLVAV